MVDAEMAFWCGLLGRIIVLPIEGAADFVL